MNMALTSSSLALTSMVPSSLSSISTVSGSSSPSSSITMSSSTMASSLSPLASMPGISAASCSLATHSNSRKSSSINNTINYSPYTATTATAITINSGSTTAQQILDGCTTPLVLPLLSCSVPAQGPQPPTTTTTATINIATVPPHHHQQQHNQSPQQPFANEVNKALEMFMVTTAQTPLPIIAVSSVGGHPIFAAATAAAAAAAAANGTNGESSGHTVQGHRVHHLQPVSSAGSLESVTMGISHHHHHQMVAAGPGKAVQSGSQSGLNWQGKHIVQRITTLERRDEAGKALIESALDNTEKIVANLLATKKQVVLKERTTPCYVVL